MCTCLSTHAQTREIVLFLNFLLLQYSMKDTSENTEDFNELIDDR